MLGERRDQDSGYSVATTTSSENGHEPAPPPPAEVFRCEAAGFRSARLLCAAFRELSATFTPQVAAQLALDLTKTVLASPSGAKILEE